MTQEECETAMWNKTPVVIEGSYKFYDTPTTIISVGWMSVRVKGSDDHYEHHRIELAPETNAS